MANLNIVTIKNPKSPLAEAYRTLRTNIQFSSFDKRIQTIVVTSSQPGEGKSTTAANLAVVMAQGGHKTILLDCDQRKPTQHKVFGQSNLTGISNLLIGEVRFEDAVIKTEVENLCLLTAGIRPPNPAELLGSGRMRSLLTKLREEFEYIIIDTPPVLAVTDAQVASKYADGCLLVTASGEADREAAMRAKELLVKVDAKIIGVILNKLDTSRKGYYGQYYHYYYGEDKDTKQKKKKRGFGLIKKRK